MQLSYVSRLCTPILSNNNFMLKSGAFQTIARNFHMMLRTDSQIAFGTSTPLAPSIIESGVRSGYLQRFLTPISSLLTQVAGFKVKAQLRLRCKSCYIVVRENRRYVICPTHPRHKQMAMKKRDYKSWILTHATQSKVRPY